MLLYRLVRPIATIGLRTFYRKIYLSHADRIPWGQPVILASNHPTAFLEPCILACFLPKPLHFLVRGDLFVKPLYNRLLRSLNMLPVYRLKDGGYGKLRNNYSTFSVCYEALSDRQAIMILAEGNTIQEKRLRPLQKGVARLALGAIEATEDLQEVYIVPVGVNFTHADQPRTTVMIEFGEPMKASDYWPTYQENSNQGITELTTDLRQAMLPHIVALEDKADEPLLEDLLPLVRSEQNRTSPPVLEKTGQALRSEIMLADQLNALPSEPKEELRRAASGYQEHLQQFGLDDRVLAGRDFAEAGTTAQLVLGFPFQLVGWLWNFPPTRLGKYVARTKVKSLEFKMPVRWAVTLGAYLVYVPLWALIFCLTLGWKALSAIPVLLGLGYYTLFYQELGERYQKSRRLKLELPKRQLAQLRERRASVWQLLQDSYN